MQMLSCFFIFEMKITGQQKRHLLVNILSAVPASAFLVYFVWFLVQKEFRYDFLIQPFNSDVTGGFLKLQSSDFVWVAALKGVGNTLMLVGLSISIASVLGLFLGIMRLSTNLLLRGIARVYVEILRNVPLLVLMFLFAFVVFAKLPGIQEAAGIKGLILVSNRGVALPEFVFAPFAWVWLLVLLLIVFGVVMFWRWLNEIQDETGKRNFGFFWSVLLLIILGFLSHRLMGKPVQVLSPVLDVTSLFPSYSQGFVLNLGYLSALLSLSLYFGAFIAEIVRGSIQAIPREQSEAAESLGLTSAQRLQLVILPQALRIMIPSLNNEYQNTNKDSSLAHFITYAEVVFVALQVANNRGNLIELFLGVFLIYVVLNLIISSVMNLINRLVQVVG